MAAARKTDWLTLGLLLIMYLVLGGNFLLHRVAPLPLIIHVAIAAAAIHLSFTIWHEAAHRNVSPRLWVNRVVGVLGMFPYLTPFFMQRWIHLEHHARLNQRDDPNYVYIDGPFWMSRQRDRDHALMLFGDRAANAMVGTRVGTALRGNDVLRQVILALALRVVRYATVPEPSTAPRHGSSILMANVTTRNRSRILHTSLRRSRDRISVTVPSSILRS